MLDDVCLLSSIAFTVPRQSNSSVGILRANWWVKRGSRCRSSYNLPSARLETMSRPSALRLIGHGYFERGGAGQLLHTQPRGR